MGFQFAETMAGTVEWRDAPGVQHPLSFEITAAAASTRAHLRDGKAAVRGVLHAPPLAAAAPLTGTLTIRPIGQRIIRYELQFTGDDGKPYALVGQKDIDWRDMGRTFTELSAEILGADQQPIGTCRARFDARRDLWTFLRSFRRS